MKTFLNHIVVMDKGFVYHGDLYVSDDGWCSLERAHNVRRYGTQRGLGQLALEGPTQDTQLDEAAPLRFRETALVFAMGCAHEKLYSGK